MIRSLRGTVEGTGTTYLVLNVQGVGYLIHMNTLKYGYEVGDSVHLHTYLAVRETALDLYGFPTTSELDFFNLLLSIPKIGPKSALQILGQADVTVLTEAIQARDAGHLHKVSGIGKKTAENIVQFLYDKVENLPNARAADATATTPAASRSHSDAIAALISLGYNPGEARSTVRTIANFSSTTDLIKQALQQLSQN